jgi:fluoride exporter
MNWLAVGLGAACGAWLRWGLSTWLNAYHHALPYGTLIVNLAGGYLIGIAVGVFEKYPALPIEWRLLVVTGFLGGLTTFSTFSAESMLLLQRGEFGWALGHILLHLLGSILLCIGGFATYRALVA